MFGSRNHDLKTVEDAIRAGRVMLMAAGSLPIEQLEQLLRCAATAGVPAFEILRRGVSQNDLAEKLRRLRRIREEDTTLDAVHVGVGTIKGSADLNLLLDASPLVDFVVSPYMSEAVAGKCRQQVLYIPGVDNGTALEAAERHNLKIWKWFPATELGHGMLQAWSAIVNPGTFAISTGGVTAENAHDWAKFGGAGIGSEFVKAGQIQSGEWDAITAALTSAVERSREVKLVFPE